MEEVKLLVCDDCKAEFFLKAVDIKTDDVQIGHKKLKLEYFMCPECNKIYRIAIIDDKYQELVNDLNNMRKRIRKKRGSFDCEGAMVFDGMLNAKKERLLRYAKKLNGKYTGTFTFVNTSLNNDKGQPQIIYREQNTDL